MSHFIVSGVPGPLTQGTLPPNRLEINDLIKDNFQFSLYVQALIRMFDASQSDEISHFQIGGIHGLPYIQWEGAGGTESVSTEWGGYCTHGSVLFPTWHRPYVALYEQVLNKHAQKIASEYTSNQDRWVKAAVNLRAPYWDWAANTVPPPEVISLAQVTITTPDGKQTVVDNPLLAYPFHPIDPSFKGRFSRWNTTLRHPPTQEADAKSNVEDLTSTLQSVQQDVRTKTLNLLLAVHTWPAFSNHTPEDGGAPYTSLEGIHDGIHDDVGGSYGHMSDLAYAGFDPIFFLHHCNVDRVLALWQAINPDIWVTQGSVEEGSFTIAADVEVDGTTALTPFWESQDSFWASAQVANFTKLGYSYPDFNGLDLGKPKALRTAIAKIVKQLYGGPAPSPEKPSELFDWTARVRVKKYALDSSFTVLIFLGEVPEDPAQWRSSPNFVGAHYALVNSAAHRCENCRRQSEGIVEGFVPLNYAITKHSGLISLKPNVVVPYLAHALRWRVQKERHTSVDLSDLPSLDIDVISTIQTFPPGEVIPVLGESRHHHEITEGRQGGHRSSA